MKKAGEAEVEVIGVDWVGRVKSDWVGSIKTSRWVGSVERES